MAKIKDPKKFDDLPPSRRHAAIIEEIENEKQTDRGVAIIGAAYVDLVLRQAITERLVPDEELMVELFENRGPLQDFGARVHVAFALKVYGRAFYNDLRAIKDIRNAFAHSADAMDFNHRDVRRLCENLSYPQRIQYRGRPSPATPRELYVRAIALLTDLLHQDFLSRNRSTRSGLPPMFLGSSVTRRR